MVNTTDTDGTIRPMANEVSARIAYDGDALRGGTMDVRALAPALLAVGDLLQQANRVLNDDKATLAVNVNSEFKRGSFELSFELKQAFDYTYLFLGVQTLKTAKEVAEYVGFVTGIDISLFGLLKYLRGQKPVDTTTLKDGNIQVTIKGDHNSVVVNPVVYQLASDPGVRKAARDVVQPLHADGVDRFEVRDGAKIVESITREDLPAFELPSTQDDHPIADVDPERVTALEVIKPSFQEDLSWVFSDGSGGRLGALMLDKNFLKRVQSGQRMFAKGDVLRVRLRTRAYFGVDGLRTEHAVLEVLQEIDQPRQHAMLPTPRFVRQPLVPEQKTSKTFRKLPRKKGRKR